MTLPELQTAWLVIMRGVRGREGKRPMRIEFTGGEPTVNPHFRTFTAWLKERHRRAISSIQVTTNGSRSPRYYVDLLASVDTITYSSHFEFMDPARWCEAVILTHRAAVKMNGKKRIFVNLMLEPWALSEAAYIEGILKREGVSFSARPIRNHYESTGLRNARMRNLKNIGLQPAFVPIDSLKYATATKSSTRATQVLRGIVRMDGRGRMAIVRREATEGCDGDGDVIITKQDARQRVAEAAKIIASNRNRFCGWLCDTGIAGIHIYNDGNVYGSVCRTKKLGDLKRGFSLASEGVVCPKDVCSCISDVRITKRVARGTATSS